MASNAPSRYAGIRKGQRIAPNGVRFEQSPQNIVLRDQGYVIIDQGRTFYAGIRKGQPIAGRAAHFEQSVLRDRYHAHVYRERALQKPEPELSSRKSSGSCSLRASIKGVLKPLAKMLSSKRKQEVEDHNLYDAIQGELRCFWIFSVVASSIPALG